MPIYIVYLGQMKQHCNNIRHKSRCHDNVHLNGDSKSQRSIPIALHVSKFVDVRGVQSERHYTYIPISLLMREIGSLTRINIVEQLQQVLVSHTDIPGLYGPLWYSFTNVVEPFTSVSQERFCNPNNSNHVFQDRVS